jgi:hypothetical protein
VVTKADSPLGFPKPRPKKDEKKEKRAHAKKVVNEVRAAVKERDKRLSSNGCRFPEAAKEWWPCFARLEWAHLRSRRRSKTGGQPPEVRHTTAGSCGLCYGHHVPYDAGKYEIRPVDPVLGADGDLEFWNGDELIGRS